jgi:uracil-DNA glycosylase family 4
MQRAQVVDPQAHGDLVLVRQLASEAPADANVAEVVDDAAEDVPIPLHGRHANIAAMPTFSDPDGCVACPRLAAHLATIRMREPSWHARPVPSFGSLDARLLVVGLGPGERGANRTGRPFTGDVAGDLLYPALYRFGFASAGEALGTDGWANPSLNLNDCRITNAVRCLPPANKPTPAEIRQCNSHMKAELGAMARLKVILGLGTVAHAAVLRAYGLRLAAYQFGHDVRHVLPDGRLLVDSYHCSGYNWRTGRLSRESFEAVFAGVRRYLDR